MKIRIEEREYQYLCRKREDQISTRKRVSRFGWPWKAHKALTEPKNVKAFGVRRDEDDDDVFDI